MENDKPFEWNEITLSPPDATGRKRHVGFPLKGTPVLTTDCYGNIRILCYCDEYDRDDPEDGPYWYNPDTEDYVCDGWKIECWMYVELPQRIKERKEQMETAVCWEMHEYERTLYIGDSALKAMEERVQAWKQQR